MSNVRLRRLSADYDAVRRLVRSHPKVKLDGVAGNPPDRYRLVMHVTSLRERGEEVHRADEHLLEVALPLGYPRDPPVFRMLTPVFHPNIAPHAVCIGDHWSAGESLDHMILRVGEMLAFQSYNVKSPLNGRAARWVEEHADEVPLEREEFFRDLGVEPVVPAAGPRCANCGAAGAPAVTCTAGHGLCADCEVHCPTCKALLCLKCGAGVCPTCVGINSGPCANCGANSEKLSACPAGHRQCPDCSIFCQRCGSRLCFVCGTYPCPSCRAAAG